MSDVIEGEDTEINLKGLPDGMYFISIGMNLNSTLESLKYKEDSAWKHYNLKGHNKRIHIIIYMKIKFIHMKTKVLIYSFLILLISSCFSEKITGGVDDVVKIVVADKLMIDNNINDNTNLRNDLGADELDMVEITMELEYQYDLVISDNDMDKFYTIGDLIMYIEKNQH